MNYSNMTTITLERYTLDIRVKGRRKAEFIIWDNKTGKIVKDKIVNFKQPEQIATVKSNWVKQVEELNK